MDIKSYFISFKIPTDYETVISSFRVVFLDSWIIWWQLKNEPFLVIILERKNKVLQGVGVESGLVCVKTFTVDLKQAIYFILASEA